MSTNKIAPLRSTSAATTADPRKRRARLEALLDIRSRLAAVAAERRSHNLDDASETFQEQMLVEATIDQEFPGVVDERFADWLAADVRLEHDPGALHPECGICRATAQRSGVNLLPPFAA